MAFELPPLPNLTVNQPPPFDPLAQRQKQATLAGLLSENALRQQLAPLNVQEAQGRVQAQDIENQIKTIQLEGQRALSDWLQNGDANAEVPAEKFSSNDRIATYVGVTPDDPIMSVVRSMAQHHVPAPMLMAEAQGMLQRRNEYYKGTKEEQDAQANERKIWQQTMAELHEMPEDQRSVALATKLPLLQENSKTDPLLGAYAKGLAGHPELIDQAYNVVSAENAALGLRETKAKAGKAEAEEMAAKNKLPGGPQESVPERELRDWLTAHPGKNAADYEIAMKQIPARTQYELAGGATGGLSPEAIDQQAEKYYQTGVLPPSGRGPAGIALGRTIIQRASELHPGASLAAGSAEFKANQESLKTLQKSFDQVSAFENTANKNLDLFTSLAQKAIDSGIPLLNAPLRTGAMLLGGKDQAALNTARQVAINEIAKVTSNPGLSGQLSDSARHEIEAFNPQSATFGQTMAVAKVLKQDMANRHQSYQEQINDIQGRLGQKAPVATQAGGGLIYARDPQGKLHSAPAGTKLPEGWKEEKKP